MQHAHDLGYDLELVLGYVDPQVERGHELRPNIFPRIRDDIRKRLQYGLAQGAHMNELHTTVSG